jgi:hypothetical protein
MTLHKSQIDIFSNLQTNLRKKKNELCIKDTVKIKSATCNIDDVKIRNISYFLANILPNCNIHNIKLENIRNGKIIGKGEFGYSFKITNNSNKSYIVKIIICDENYIAKKDIEY